MSISEARWFTDVPPVAPVVAGVSAVARMVTAAGHDLLGAEYLTDACAEGGEWLDMCAFDPTIGKCVPPVPLSTGATAGAPGAWTPAPPASRVPTLQEITSGQIVVTPSPATAWTEGQYVVTADGVEGYWDGTAWKPGRAPAPPAVPPTITSLTPNTGVVGVPQTTQVDGTGFVSGQVVVKIDGQQVPTGFISATRLTATWTPAAAATRQFVVHNNILLLTSNSVPFVVTAAVFDPANFTIQEVKDHVEALPNNAARTPEIQRILDLERAHKNRTTLVTWLDEQTGVV